MRYENLGTVPAGDREHIGNGRFSGGREVGREQDVLDRDTLRLCCRGHGTPPRSPASQAKVLRPFRRGLSFPAVMQITGSSDKRKWYPQGTFNLQTINLAETLPAQQRIRLRSFNEVEPPVRASGGSHERRRVSFLIFGRLKGNQLQVF